jgi:hypothetical protein
MRTYWVCPSTLDVWTSWQQAGSDTIGFRNPSGSLAQQIKVGDYLLQYVTRLQRWIGILEVTSEAYYDDSPRYQGDEFPCRVKVRVVVQLTPDTAIPLSDLKGQLTTPVGSGTSYGDRPRSCQRPPMAKGSSR